MGQDIQMHSGIPAFPPGGFYDGDRNFPVRELHRSSILFVGPKEVGDELATLGGVDFASARYRDAASRLRGRVLTDILWLAAAESIEGEIFAELCRAALDRKCSLVCETSLAALDRVAGAIPEALRADILVDADPTDRRIALAGARRRAGHQVVHEVTRDPAMERIDRLQEEVARIARLLGDLAGQHGGLAGAPNAYAPIGEGYGDYPGQVRSPPRDFAAMPRSFVPEERAVERQRAKVVRRMLRQRRMREQYFPADLFADPAWDMLLDLYAARLERQPVSVSSLCIAAAVPATTALRWIKTMTDAGLFVREADPQDGRRIFIALVEGAHEAMTRYFEALDE
jgi:DNA-binding MarR family transcriptional regulator